VQRLAYPSPLAAQVSSIKIHDTRMIRLMQVLLHAGTTVGGWRAQQLHEVSDELWACPTNATAEPLPLRLRKMRAHALLERDGNRYAYRLTERA